MFEGMKLVIEYGKLKDYLVNTAHYPEQEAVRLIKRIRGTDIQIKRMFIRWFKTGILPTETIENVTAGDLMKYRKTDEIKAFLLLDWLKSDPEEAKSALMSSYDSIIKKDNDKDKDKYKVKTEEKAAVEEDTSDINSEK
jgi:hypothetical protein